MKKILLCGMAMFALCAAAQTEVTDYRPGVTAEGITYYLPRTVIRVAVTAERTDYTPGDYCQYADRYLHLSNVSPTPSTSWRITRVIMQPEGVPDTAKIFSIRLKDKTVAPLVRLTDDGIILAINTESDEKPLALDVPAPITTNNKRNSRDYMNAEILSATSTAKMAELTAEEIFTIRESRNGLTRGEADNLPKDGAQLKLMLDQLTAQDEALTQLFKGSQSTTTQTFTFIIDPKEDVQRSVLFRFSQKLGVVDGDDLGGSPIYYSVTDNKTVPAPVQDEENRKKKLENAIRYNVPSKATIKIFDTQKTLCEAEYAMGQFGNVELLSNALFNKKNTTTVTFYGINGGLKKVEAGE